MLYSVKEFFGFYMPSDLLKRAVANIMFATALCPLFGYASYA